MNNDVIRLPLMMVVLCAIQVFVLNHCQLFGCAMPLFYVWLVVSMRKSTPRWVIMVLAFVLGLALGTFDNMPGVAAAAMTAAAMAQPKLLELFISREGDEAFIPSMKTLGVKPFVNYTIVLVGGYCVLFFTLEMFSFFNMLHWLECVVGSTVVTVALILAADKALHRA